MARPRSFQRHLREQANPLDCIDTFGSPVNEQARDASEPVFIAATAQPKQRPLSGYRFRLVGTLARALRHAPGAYGITLDPEDVTIVVKWRRA